MLQSVSDPLQKCGIGVFQADEKGSVGEIPAFRDQSVAADLSGDEGSRPRVCGDVLRRAVPGFQFSAAERAGLGALRCRGRRSLHGALVVGEEVPGAQRIGSSADCVIVAKRRAGPVGADPKENLGEFPEGLLPGEAESCGAQTDHAGLRGTAVCVTAGESAGEAP
jgi:hypothetical protein